MEIIPVIDLMHGHVVHARMGQRQHYQPIQSLLCRSSAPMDVISAILELYPFKRIYIADLDAITGQGNHATQILNIQTQYPNIEIWLDAGIKNVDTLATWKTANVTHVVGSENLASLYDLTEINQKLNGNFILSLDFNQAGFLGPADLQTQTEHWPEKVIAMTLNQVGSQLGADIEQLQTIISHANNRAVYAAGGIRNNEDLNILQNLRVAGALVATTLHNKKLSFEKIRP